MNATEWRKAGYKTIFRWNRVVLYQPLSGMVAHTPVAGGRWMDSDDIHCYPWTIEPDGIESLPPVCQDDLRLTAAYCYCDKSAADLCDFCAGLRTPEERTVTYDRA